MKIPPDTYEYEIYLLSQIGSAAGIIPQDVTHRNYKPDQQTKQAFVIAEIPGVIRPEAF